MTSSPEVPSAEEDHERWTAREFRLDRGGTDSRYWILTMLHSLSHRGLAAFAVFAMLFANPLSATANSHLAPELDAAAAAGDDTFAGLDMQVQEGARLANNRRYVTKNMGRWRAYPRSMVLMIRGMEAVSRNRPGGGGGNGGGGGGNGGGGGGNGGGRPGRL